ncbi:MAG: hypothetical protein GWN01_03665 [Nitrosopumilaceae archaeon]|nr:hypothetical protein [Nitrosopumilaceae archaeon]NIU00055.1 hypothetical protein [Nitrosopumilaceae archaeon]NIU86434.1 hypothetical protein [Nitrosopumilaceae archaeon]NIV65143.1 hypothetical protein [Nitrosopumilaceae archaeon]NIX60657.1 hypothetical protein [Nitrosopumilaceae archaeon]
MKTCSIFIELFLSYCEEQELMLKLNKWLKPASKDKLHDSAAMAKDYDNYKPFIWFCIGYLAAILTSFMNIWWK